MGFYSLYKIIKDFLKKPFRTALIFIIIVIIISFCSSCFAAESYNFYQDDNNYKTDPVQLCNQYQNSVLSTLYNSLYYNRKYKLDEDLLNTLITDMSTYFYYCQYLIPEDPSYSDIYVYVYDKYSLANSTEINTHFTFNNDYVNVPIVARNITAKRYLLKSNTHRITTTSSRFTVAVPFTLCGVRNSNFDELLYNFNNKSTDDLYVMLQNINENLKKTNDFLNDTNIDNSNVNTPSQPSQSDPTSSGFDNIFNSFKSAFTDSYDIEMSIPIPFTNRSFYLQSNFLSKYLKDMKFIGNVGLLDFVHMFWLFVFSLYIVKDVEKVVEKIKNGDIATSSDTNIKTEML